MKNKATDLHNHLFEQLERLNDTSIKGTELTDEIKRSEAMTTVALTIVANGRLALDARKMAEEYSLSPEDLPDMLLAEAKPANKQKLITGK